MTMVTVMTNDNCDSHYANADDNESCRMRQLCSVSGQSWSSLTTIARHRQSQNALEIWRMTVKSQKMLKPGKTVGCSKWYGNVRGSEEHLQNSCLKNHQITLRHQNSHLSIQLPPPQPDQEVALKQHLGLIQPLLHNGGWQSILLHDGGC